MWKFIFVFAAHRRDRSIFLRNRRAVSFNWRAPRYGRAFMKKKYIFEPGSRAQSESSSEGVVALSTAHVKRKYSSLRISTRQFIPSYYGVRIMLPASDLCK